MSKKIEPGKKSGLHCPECTDGEQVYRQNRETEEFFLACTNYPMCKWSANLPEHLRLSALGVKGLFDE